MPAPTATAAAARYYETRQQVAIATGHLVDGIRAEQSRERVIPPGDARTVRSELLAQLRAAAERGVALTPPPGSDATIRGWLEAASVAADNARNPTLGATRLSAFRNRYPSHPALAALSGEPGVGIEAPPAALEAGAAPGALAAAHGSRRRPGRADPRRLHDGLLPVAGEFAPAAAPLRQRRGTHRRHHGAGRRGRRRIHRRTADPRGSGRRRRSANYPAADPGAQFPAGRPSAARALLPVRALARRRCTRGGALHRQHGQDARRGDRPRRRLGIARGCGIRRGVARRRRIRARAGDVQHCRQATTATAIMQVLRTDDSRARQQRVQAAIGQKLEFEPRRRPDIQFIFAPSQRPTVARLLRPQLRFHLAGDIPTYTLGDAYEPHPTANQEIDGVMFPDMPWMLGVDGLSAEVRAAARAGIRRIGGAARPAVRLRLRRAAHRGGAAARPENPPQGLTGTLSMDSQGRVRRELEWVRIKSGAPTPLETIRDHAPPLPDAAGALAWIAVRPARCAENSACAFLESQGFFHRHAQFPAPRRRARRGGARRGSAGGRRSAHARQRRIRRRRGQHRAAQTTAHRRHGRLLLQRYPELRRCRVRFDVIVVRDGSIEWLKHAFDA